VIGETDSHGDRHH